MSIKVSELDGALEAVMKEYSGEAYEGMKRAVDATAKAASREILRHTAFRDRTGDYRRSFSLRKEEHAASGTYRKIWHAKGNQWFLTHLLERGHKAPDGSRVRDYPHIAYGEKLAKEMLPEELEKELGG